MNAGPLIAPEARLTAIEARPTVPDDRLTAPEDLPMLNALWSRILLSLESKVQATALESWLRPCRLAGADGDQLRLTAPSAFAREQVVRHHLDTLRAAAREVLGGNPQVTIELDRFPHADPGAASHAGGTGNGSRGGHGLPESHDSGLASRYTFAAFVVGKSNQLAQAACRAVAECPSRTYNPLFLYGGSGLGKTHLLRAIGHEITRRHPSLRLAYLSSERFTNELISAIRHDRTPDFRAKYRSIDVLLIDDIQFISGKERTQGEFAHTFNDLYEGRSQIVVSSDCPPRKIPEIEDQLRSRLEGGLIADIRPPEFETRLGIVRKRAEMERVELSDGVAELIASRVRSNVREIEGCLTRLVALCRLCHREMTVEMAQNALADLWAREEPAISIDDIQRKVAECFTVPLADLRGTSRARAVVHARQIAMYLARDLTHASLADVGRAFGGRDHSTVLHAVSKVQSLLRDHPHLLDGVRP